MKKLSLAHVPTPLVRARRLGELLGRDVYVKRDDMTGGPEAGNKIRKLEYLFADALEKRATTILTCGAVQSNHARATAVVAAQLGVKCRLFLRKKPGETTENAAARVSGNFFVDKLVGAEIVFVTPDEYRDRAALMAREARSLEEKDERAYVIPEGGSNGLGAFGYIDALKEIATQASALGVASFDHAFFACGSGGTAAGIALGAEITGIVKSVHAACVCDSSDYFKSAVSKIVAEARAIDPSLPSDPKITFDDREKGPAYGVMSKDARAFIVNAARKTGLLFDPVYTGKALVTLAAAIAKNEIAKDARVLFIHTGGLPGLLAESDAFEGEL